MKSLLIGCSSLLLLATLGCTERAAVKADLPSEAQKPSFAIDPLSQLVVDGKTDDLVSAGLSLAQLRAGAPQPIDSENPTTAELRKLAYHQNYQSLLALSDLDGYGRLYAKGMLAGTLVAGTEYTLPVRFNDHSIAALLMVQVPSTFNSRQPCLVVTASSGSRGIYGAAGVVGAWALQKGCALASTDKGTGTGFHWLTDNQAQSTNGQLNSVSESTSHFWAKSSEKLSQFSAEFPHRIATKHAHSGKAIESQWGQFVLQAAQLGFYVLNEFHREKAVTSFYTRANTLTLGAAISNGGAAIISAAELDTEQWLDAVVVSEPNIFLPSSFSYKANAKQQNTLSLPERAINYALFGPCASMAENLPSPLSQLQLPYFSAHFANRCQQLSTAGLINGDTLTERAKDALNKMRSAGLTDEAMPMVMTSSAISLWESIVVNYGNSYLGRSVDDHLCQVSYAYVDMLGQPIATPDTIKKTLFGSGSGIIPTNGLQLINDQAQGGPSSLYFSKNAAGQYDYGFNNLMCFAKAFQSEAFQAQVNELAFTGNLHKTPTLIVQGGADNLIQPTQHSRPYLALNFKSEGENTNVHYIEVSHGQHFDSFLNYSPLRAYYVPLHLYYEQALETMFKHLTTGSSLPPSQRIQASPNQDVTQALGQLPAIAGNADEINQSPRHTAIYVDQDGVTIAEK